MTARADDTSAMGSKALITLAVMLASLMAFIDISIVNVGLSDIRASFGTPINEISWVSTSYMMANVVVIPLSGWLQKRFGYRAYLAASIAIFTAASALCGVAWSLPSLIVFRVLQGIGGGAIIPTGQAILFVRYPKDQHGKAASLIGLAAISGPLLGPYLGGCIIDAASWHWMFLINVPVGVVATLLTWSQLKEPDFRASPLPVDRVGIALLAAGLVSLQYVLEEGNRDGWFESPVIALLAAVAFVCLATFVTHEIEAENPVLDLSLFRSRSYAAATGINFLVGTSVFSGSFMFALFCGVILGYPAVEVGRVLVEGNIVLLVLLPLSGRLVGKIDGRLSIGSGVAVMAFSLWLNGRFTPQVGTWELVSPLILRAFAIAAVFVPLMPYALSDVPAERRGDASALFNLTRELGGSIGTAWMTTTLDNHSKAYVAGIGRHVDPFNVQATTELSQIERYLHGVVADPASTALFLIKNRIDLQALSIGFNDNFKWLALVFMGALALVALLKRPPEGDALEPLH